MQAKGGPWLRLGQLLFFSGWSAIFKMVRQFSVALKMGKMTSKMGGDNVKICASTRADVYIFLYMKNVKGSTLRIVITREKCIIQKSTGF